ncbi:hypothetical protein [Bacillus pseudomycoides]|uniref:hypothetical protein n=1 Tax=Bacillus pseudomycoides TaxID=64104 RepID=UPI0005086846|nr:hypothetical protein [Bacillus pseudomycoides]KFN11942.1 hypothetical protein DJ94_5329 [Bacillus pseudomycoides]MDR4188105.1 hypothetical protein [Bacillus pseudomycoides]MED0855802.1 hypothetical protein [Bacillus pseudomycoides]
MRKKINKIFDMMAEIENWVYVPLAISVILAFCMIVSILYTLLLQSPEKSEMKASILKSIGDLQTMEYRVIDYSKNDKGTSSSNNETIDLIIKDDQETYNFKIEYVDKDGNLKVMSKEQAIIVKYDESIKEPKLTMKKVPDKERKGKYATISEYVNPTLYIPLNK